MFAVRDVPGKGKGLVATQRITKGTCILSEAPVVAITLSPPTKDVEKLWSPVTNLPVGHRQAFEALAKCHPYENTFGLYLSVVRTNSFRIRDGVAGVCIIASRINHACISNAQHSWNDNLKELTVHAVRHIEKDEEITINYMGHGHTRAERQEYLQRLYSFECACTLCSLSVALSEAADRKILRTRKLWSYFLIKEPPTQYLVNPLQRLRRLEEIARYRSELGSSTQLYDTYNEAATLAVFHSDAARAKAFLDRAYNAYILGHGATDETAIACQKRRQDVLGLVCTSPSTRWETDEILPPRDEEFEDWLWKREERLPEPSLFADLEDPSTFMGVGSLPIEGFFDLEYHQNASFGQSQPKRHWCLLGQIDSQPNTAGRLHFRLRDLTNYVTGVSFHDSHKGSKISQSLHTGDTVVILYAQRGKSEIGQTVKIKNTNMFRVCGPNVGTNSRTNLITVRLFLFQSKCCSD